MPCLSFAALKGVEIRRCSEYRPLGDTIDKVKNDLAATEMNDIPTNASCGVRYSMHYMILFEDPSLAHHFLERNVPMS
jgi:hypothetical protein